MHKANNMLCLLMVMFLATAVATTSPDCSTCLNQYITEKKCYAQDYLTGTDAYMSSETWLSDYLASDCLEFGGLKTTWPGRSELYEDKCNWMHFGTGPFLTLTQLQASATAYLNMYTEVKDSATQVKEDSVPLTADEAASIVQCTDDGFDQRAVNWDRPNPAYSYSYGKVRPESVARRTSKVSHFSVGSGANQRHFRYKQCGLINEVCKSECPTAPKSDTGSIQGIASADCLDESKRTVVADGQCGCGVSTIQYHRNQGTGGIAFGMDKNWYRAPQNKLEQSGTAWSQAPARASSTDRDQAPSIIITDTINFNDKSFTASVWVKSLPRITYDPATCDTAGIPEPEHAYGWAFDTEGISNPTCPGKVTTEKRMEYIFWMGDDDFSLFLTAGDVAGADNNQKAAFRFGKDVDTAGAKNNQNVAVTDTPFTDSEFTSWFHLAVTLDRDSLAMTVFRDGTPQTSTTTGATGTATSSYSGPVTIGSKRFSIGSGTTGAVDKDDEHSHMFTGAMDEIRIYVGVALTTAQVASVMTSASVIKSEYGLVLSLSFDGRTLRDPQPWCPSPDGMSGAACVPTPDQYARMEFEDSSCGGDHRNTGTIPMYTKLTLRGRLTTVQGKICSALSVDRAATLSGVTNMPEAGVDRAACPLPE